MVAQLVASSAVLMAGRSAVPLAALLAAARVVLKVASMVAQ